MIQFHSRIHKHRSTLCASLCWSDTERDEPLSAFTWQLISAFILIHFRKMHILMEIKQQSAWTLCFAYFWPFNVAFDHRFTFSLSFSLSVSQIGLLLDVTLCGLPANVCERSSRWLPWQPGPTHPTRHSHSVKHPFSDKLERCTHTWTHTHTRTHTCTCTQKTHTYTKTCTHLHAHYVKGVTGVSVMQRCFISRKLFFPPLLFFFFFLSK